MTLRIYLDTSVFSAYLDARAPERMESTREFWARLGQFEPHASALVAEELSFTPDAGRRAALDLPVLEILSPPELLGD